MDGDDKPRLGIELCEREVKISNTRLIGELQGVDAALILRPKLTKLRKKNYYQERHYTRLPPHQSLPSDPVPRALPYNPPVCSR